MILLHYFFDLTSFYRLGQKYKNIFVRFLVQMKTLKNPFEINWPLGIPKDKMRKNEIEGVAFVQSFVIEADSIGFLKNSKAIWFYPVGLSYKNSWIKHMASDIILLLTRWIYVGQKHWIYECGFSKAWLSNHHESEFEALFDCK